MTTPTSLPDSLPAGTPSTLPEPHRELARVRELLREEAQDPDKRAFSLAQNILQRQAEGSSLLSRTRVQATGPQRTLHLYPPSNQVSR